MLSYYVNFQKEINKRETAVREEERQETGEEDVSAANDRVDVSKASAVQTLEREKQTNRVMGAENNQGF